MTLSSIPHYTNSRQTYPLPVGRRSRRSITEGGRCPRSSRLGTRGTREPEHELGAQAPLVVFADADIEAAVKGAVVGVFINTGQDRCGATRLYIQYEVFEYTTVKNVMFDIFSETCKDWYSMVLSGHL